MAAPQIARIDFAQTRSGVVVTKYQRLMTPDGPRDVVADYAIKPDLDLDWALAWCEAHGFTVRRWPGGARAFRGKPWPIRTVGEIKRRREQVERDVRLGALPRDFYWAGLDFALDC
jgi:hypothetical protein